MNKDFKYEHTIGVESPIPKDMPKEHSLFLFGIQKTGFMRMLLFPIKLDLSVERFLKVILCNQVMKFSNMKVN